MLPPAVSWGVLLQDAQDVQAIAKSDWLLIAVLFVIITVLMFNFLGDGLRDCRGSLRPVVQGMKQQRASREFRIRTVTVI